MVSATSWIWITDTARQGIKGVRLEVLSYPRRLLTSLAAVQRFTERLAEIDAAALPDAATSPLCRHFSARSGSPFPLQVVQRRRKK